MVSTVDCLPKTCYLEMMMTKQRFKKTDGVCFYHFVHSFSEKEKVSPWKANQVARELTERLFPNYECVVATHTDTDNIHSHIVVNSVRHTDGKKLHLNPSSLEEMRRINDLICTSHGLSALEPYQGKQKKKRLSPGEYRAAERSESWKFALILAIEEALEYSPTRETFIDNLEAEGYEVRWDDSHKYITYTCPNGMKCRDRSLHDELYLKENLERLFAYRADMGFAPGTSEPREGWMSQLQATGYLVGNLAELFDSQIPAEAEFHLAYNGVDSKVRMRELLKKLAQGQKPQGWGGMGMGR